MMLRFYVHVDRMITQVVGNKLIEAVNIIVLSGKLLIKSHFVYL